MLRLFEHLGSHTPSILDARHYRKGYVFAAKPSRANVSYGRNLEFIKSYQKLELKWFLANILGRERRWNIRYNYKKGIPGIKFINSNLNTALAGLINENAENESLEIYLNSKIIGPLGTKPTTWNVDEIDRTKMATSYFSNGKVGTIYRLITYPAEGLYTNTEYLNIFLKELIKSYKGESLYLPSYFAKIYFPENSRKGIFIQLDPQYGIIGHRASDPGVRTDLQYNIESTIGRIVLCNVHVMDNKSRWRQ